MYCVCFKKTSSYYGFSFETFELTITHSVPVSIYFNQTHTYSITNDARKLVDNSFIEVTSLISERNSYEVIHVRVTVSINVWLITLNASAINVLTNVRL